MKALILSAGFGTRLKPITEKIPKPLVPVLNVPVIEYNINFLKHHGISDIFINLHHLPEKMKDHLGDGSRFGVKITYLFEKEILGTGGSIASMKEHTAERFLVMNADTIFDFDLEKMLDFHTSKKALVTLGLIRAQEGQEHAVVAAANDGRLIRMLDGSPFGSTPSANAIFSGIHLIEPGLFDYLPAGIFYSITGEVYQRLVRERADLLGFFLDGPWYDTGTPEALIDASFALLSRLPLSYPVPQLMKGQGLKADQLVLLGKKTKLPAVPVLPPVIIGDGAKLAGMTEMGPWLVVGDGAVVKGGTAVQHAVYLPGAQGEQVFRSERGQLYY